MTVYSGKNCPICKKLLDELTKQNIDHTISYDTDGLIERGFSSIPVVEIDGQYKNFKETLEWLNGQN